MSSGAPVTVAGWTALVVAILALSPAPLLAQASHNELGLTGAVGYSGIPGFAGDARGPRALLAASWGLPRGFAVQGFAARSEYFGRDDLRGAATTFGLGATYNVDVIALVPFVGLAPVLQTTSGDVGEPARAGLRGVLGADWRRMRKWSIGGQIEWLGFFPSIFDYPAEAAVMVRWTWYLDLRRW